MRTSWRSSRRPRVSVGMPVYNGERYLAEAVDSLLAQTYEDFELIICDNASTDRTGEIARSYAARDTRVRYARNEKNLGAGGEILPALCPPPRGVKNPPAVSPTTPGRLVSRASG